MQIEGCCKAASGISYFIDEAYFFTTQRGFYFDYSERQRAETEPSLCEKTTERPQRAVTRPGREIAGIYIPSSAFSLRPRFSLS